MQVQVMQVVGYKSITSLIFIKVKVSLLTLIMLIMKYQILLTVSF